MAGAELLRLKTAGRTSMAAGARSPASRAGRARPAGLSTGPFPRPRRGFCGADPGLAVDRVPEGPLDRPLDADPSRSCRWRGGCWGW